MLLERLTKRIALSKNNLIFQRSSHISNKLEDTIVEKATEEKSTLLEWAEEKEMPTNLNPMLEESIMIFQRVRDYVLYVIEKSLPLQMNTIVSLKSFDLRMKSMEDQIDNLSLAFTRFMFSHNTNLLNQRTHDNSDKENEQSNDESTNNVYIPTDYKIFDTLLGQYKHMVNKQGLLVEEEYILKKYEISEWNKVFNFSSNFQVNVAPFGTPEVITVSSTVKNNDTDLLIVEKRINDSLKPLLLMSILDATTGQNGLEQAKAFHQATPITCIILTKLDGSTRGGTLFAIQRSLKIPVKFIGIGEKPAHLIPFDPELFVQSMLYDEKEPLLSLNRRGSYKSLSFMNPWIALLLGTIQGIIEFFPIFSSGHIKKTLYSYLLHHLSLSFLWECYSIQTSLRISMISLLLHVDSWWLHLPICLRE
ncbi:hypothetical protein ACTFIR_003934 [Dictyostelium discoideum]